MEQTPITQLDVAAKLLFPLWLGLNSTYKTKYKTEVWQHFENNLNSAAYTSSLSRFLQNFREQLPCEIPARYAKDAISIVSCGQDDEVLQWLRTESTYMALLVREQNETRKAEYKALQEEREQMEAEAESQTISFEDL